MDRLPQRDFEPALLFIDVMRIAVCRNWARRSIFPLFLESIQQGVEVDYSQGNLIEELPIGQKKNYSSDCQGWTCSYIWESELFASHLGIVFLYHMIGALTQEDCIIFMLANIAHEVPSYVS